MLDDETLNGLCCFTGFGIGGMDGGTEFLVRRLQGGGESLEDALCDVGAPAGGADEGVQVHTQGIAGEAGSEECGDDVVCGLIGRSWVRGGGGEQRGFLVGVGFVLCLLCAAGEAGKKCLKTFHCHVAS